MKKELLSLAESKALRGIAILGIVLHNYCHFLGFAVKENEYTFTAEKPLAFWEKLLSLDGDMFIHFFSFLGHYGVPVFLFISGFGLVMKYEAAYSGPHAQASGGLKADLAWIRYHFLKLFRLMILGYLVFILVYANRHPAEAATAFSWDRVAAQLTMVINFVFMRPSKVILPGPYWFFGLMIQLYILYRLLFARVRSGWFILSFVLLCWAVQWAADELSSPQFEALNYVRYNFVGGILPFCMGILYARHGRLLTRRAYAGIVLLSAVGVLVGSLWFHAWLWVPFFVVTGAVSTVKLLPQAVLNPCIWMGGVSSALFVMHPLAREIVISHYRKIDIYYGIAVYLLAAVALALLLQYVLRWVPSPKLKK